MHKWQIWFIIKFLSMRKITSNIWGVFNIYLLSFTSFMVFLSIFNRDKYLIMIIFLSFSLFLFILFLFLNYFYKIVFVDESYIYFKDFLRFRTEKISLDRIVEVKKINFIFGGGFNTKIKYISTNNKNKSKYFTPKINDKNILEKLLRKNQVGSVVV